MKNPKVSIVMPVKNAMPFFKECLDSVLMQTYSNWELLVVNDGSTDDSLAILFEYEQKDNRIKVYSNNGVGIIDALRLAYANSSGELVTRMDADDIMSEDKLQIMSDNLLSAGKGNLAVGLVKYFAEGEESIMFFF